MGRNKIELLDQKIKLLLSSKISRANKMHLCSTWGVEWRFKNGEWFSKDGQMPGRMEFLIDNTWQSALSWDEDEKIKLKDNER